MGAECKGVGLPRRPFWVDWVFLKKLWKRPLYYTLQSTQTLSKKRRKSLLGRRYVKDMVAGPQALARVTPQKPGPKRRWDNRRARARHAGTRLRLPSSGGEEPALVKSLAPVRPDVGGPALWEVGRSPTFSGALPEVTPTIPPSEQGKYRFSEKKVKSSLGGQIQGGGSHRLALAIGA
jgi:hypothetical protein